MTWARGIRRWALGSTGCTHLVNCAHDTRTRNAAAASVTQDEPCTGLQPLSTVNKLECGHHHAARAPTTLWAGSLTGRGIWLRRIRAFQQRSCCGDGGSHVAARHHTSVSICALSMCVLNHSKRVCWQRYCIIARGECARFL